MAKVVAGRAIETRPSKAHPGQVLVRVDGGDWRTFGVTHVPAICAGLLDSAIGAVKFQSRGLRGRDRAQLRVYAYQLALLRGAVETAIRLGDLPAMKPRRKAKPPPATATSKEMN